MFASFRIRCLNEVFYERNNHDGLHANYGLGAFNLSVWTPVGLFSSGFRVTTLHLCTCFRTFVVVCLFSLYV